MGELADGRTVHDYGISPQGTIHLVKRLFVGMFHKVQWNEDNAENCF